MKSNKFSQSQLVMSIANKDKLSEHTTKSSANQQTMIPGKPKRPLSAYNLFFKHERGRILAQTPVRLEGKPRRSHGKIGFGPLARSIADKWKNLDEESREYFEDLAAEDKARYKREKKALKKFLAKKAKATGTPNNGQLSSLLQEILEDTVQDVSSLEDSGLIEPCNSTQPHQRTIESVDNMALNHDLSCNIKDTMCTKKLLVRNNSELRTENSKTVQLSLHPSSCPATPPLFELCRKHPQILAEPLSLQNFAPNVFPCGTVSNNTVVNSTPIGRNISLQGPGLSELAAKLDDECMDLLCGWLVN